MTYGELFLKSASSTFIGYFLIVSVAFILYGFTSAYYILRTNSVETLEEELVAVPSLCLILFGFLLLILMIFGCCGICREIPCCLETYSIFLIVLSLAQISLGIFSLLRFKINHHDRIDQDIIKIINSTTESAECCGYGEYSSGVVDTNNIIGWSLIIVGITEIIAGTIGMSLSCAFWRNSRIMWI